MLKDHDLLLETNQRSRCDHNWIENEGKPRLRLVEDALLQARTTVVITKSILGMVSLDILFQVAKTLHWI
jgi:hypothetical protein